MNGAQHLRWAKDRALVYVDTGDNPTALASLVSDLNSHPDTAGHAAAELGAAADARVHRGLQLMTGSHLSLADPTADRAAFGLELLARTAAVHGVTTDDYAIADALLPNTPSDEVRGVFADLLNEFASARMQTGYDNKAEAAKHDGAAHALALKAVKADRSSVVRAADQTPHR